VTRYLPHPILTASVIAIWILLNQPSVGHFLLGALVGVIAGKAMSALRPPEVRLRKWWRVPGLILLVLYDIALSNVAVAGQLLRGGRSNRPGFVETQLRLRDPLALGILALILTSTPGTAWVQYDRASSRLLLHVFNLGDGTDWAAVIRDRYEAPLLEIFE
jgi:multicomponent K+:H+ antiporter subunit E